MSAALIPPALIPIARTDADWALDIAFQEESWLDSEVRVAFAHQTVASDRFELEIEPGAETNCPIRVPASRWADLSPGSYSVEVRKIDGARIDDAAVFKVQLHRGVSAETGAVAPPVGDGVAIGGVIVNRAGAAVVVRAGTFPREASLIAVNDLLLNLGADTVEAALMILAANQGFAPGSLNFSNPNNTGLGLVLGVI